MTSRAKKISHQAKKDNMKYRKNTRQRKKEGSQKSNTSSQKTKERPVIWQAFLCIRSFHPLLAQILEESYRQEAQTQGKAR